MNDSKTATDPRTGRPVEELARLDFPATPSEPLLFGIYPEKLAQRERKMVNDRRAVFTGTDTPRGPVTGLALSGGGIRSATFCLGFLQALARVKLLQRIDFLSTVSGGGYAGAFLGAWIKREGAVAVQQQLHDSDSKPVRYLRENGRYLAPNGGGDITAASASHLRSWFTMWLVLGTFVFGLLMAAETFKVGLRNVPWKESVRKGEDFRAKAAARPAPSAEAALGASVATAQPTLKAQIVAHLSISPFFRMGGWLLLVLAVPLATAYWFVGDIRRLWQLWLLLAAVGTAGYFFLAQGAGQGWSPLEKIAVSAAYLLTVVLAARELWRNACDRDAARRDFTDSMAVTLLVAGGVVVLAVIDTVGQSLATAPGWWVSVVILPGLAAAAQWVMPKLTEASKNELPGWVRSLVLPAAAALVALIALGILSMAGHLLAGALVKSLPATTVLWWVGGAATVGLVITALIKGQVLLILPAGVLAGLAIASRTVTDPDTVALLLSTLVVALATVGALLVAFLFGLNLGFVNASSHHRLYSARLTRAYLGASNPWRIDPERAKKLAKNDPTFDPDAKVGATGDVTQAVVGDQIEFLDYDPHARGGPLHLINTTVNETVSGVSNIEQRDRHGFSLVAGPAGLSARTTDHALFDTTKSKPPTGYATVCGGIADQFQTLATKDSDHVHVEMPPLGAWVGISGAAFTTGLGARTNLAFSFLLGFFNVRLGYWWDSGVRPRLRAKAAPRSTVNQLGDEWSRLFRAQSGLLDEFLARFRGPARRHWYLSDGGHFENCAVYELIRRRVPLILCCDCGADPHYEFEDVANLVRKARIDFDAEVRFLSPAQLAGELGHKDVDTLRMALPGLAASVGLPEDLKPAKDGPTAGYSAKHIAIATVSYEGATERSLLIIVKPTLSIDAPVDLRHYDATDSAFPQQSTLDQFFDEAQWESYRKLGDFVGGKLFGADAKDGSPEWEALAALADRYCPASKALQKVSSGANA